MKRSTFLPLILIAAMVVGLGTGCRKKPVGVTDIPGRTGPRSGGPGDLMGPGRGLGTESVDSGTFATEEGFKASPTEMNQGTQDREALKAQTVYFDLDSATIKSSEKAKLDEVAAYLKANPNNDVLIEGHCDERGTEGYNLSLGERRAQAAREYLVSVGASAENIYTISYGETRPADQGQGESAWSRNRRAEFVVALPAGQ